MSMLGSSTTHTHPFLSHGSCSATSRRLPLIHRPGSRCRASYNPQIARSNSNQFAEPTAAFSGGLSLLLAGSIVLNTLATPAVVVAAELAAPAPRHGTTRFLDSSPSQQPQYVIADAPDVQAPPAPPEEAHDQQQQWWQADQQVWQELTSAAELNAFMNSSQPPPAWPALDSAALNPRLRVIDFYAPWCPACKAAAPDLAEVAGDPYLRQHCTFARVNIDRVKALVRQLGITKIPTVMLLAPNGTVLDTLRASGQTVRDALEVQLAAMQQQQQPSLPPLLPPPAGESAGERAGVVDGQSAPSDIGDNGNGSSNSSNNGGVEGSSSSSSSTAPEPNAACGVVPEPSCGNLPPGIATTSSSSSNTDSNSTTNVTAGDAAGQLGPKPSNPTQLNPRTADATVNSNNSTSNTAAAAASDDEQLSLAKQQFLQQYGAQYGYGGWLEQHYQSEIGDRLGPGKHYLDYTGAALYPASLLEAVYKDLLTHSYGNPHSAGRPPVAAANSTSSNGSSSSNNNGSSSTAVPPAAASEAVMEAAAAAVLEHMHADPAEYQVVFTRSATDALRMVGELFPWNGAGTPQAQQLQQQQQPTSDLDMLTATPASQQQHQDVQQVGMPPPGSSSPAAATNISSNSSTTTSSSSSNPTPAAAASSSKSSSQSRFIYTRSNHNSVLGIGAYAAAAGAELVPLSDDDMGAYVASLQQQQQQQGSQGDEAAAAGGSSSTTTYSLLAYPAEDNYAGVTYPLTWIDQVHAAATPSARTLVLLDAAAFLPSHELDLSASAHPADFVAASAYKMFGYPTGLGVLVLRTEHVPALNKVYFGGGSVALATPEGCWHVAKCDPAAALSDGTPNYLGAAALKLAYDAWDALGGMQAVQQHTEALSSWLYTQLTALHHSNGAPLIQLYGRHGEQHQLQQSQSARQQGSTAATASGFGQGAVFNFQVLESGGQPISFSRIDKEATGAGLYLRTGCVCNPGACYDSLGLRPEEVQALAGLKQGCGDEMDFVTVMRPPPAAASRSTSSAWPWSRGAAKSDEVPTQVPLGSVRASLGWASTFEDAYALVQFLKGYLA